MAQHTQDDGFHEIQLNGKQLVFLFMAATVVSVVIFLCGVLVGRGVRAERGASVGRRGRRQRRRPTPTPHAARASTPRGRHRPAPIRPTAAPPPAVDDLSYFNRLEKPNAPAEQLKARAGRRRRPPRRRRRRAAGAGRGRRPETPRLPPRQRRSGRAAPAAASDAEPAGQGYAVQIAALNVRSEADAIAKRLSVEGLRGVRARAGRAARRTVFRVRVGKFTTRREAETIAAKLQKEEQFKPWITR